MSSLFRLPYVGYFPVNGKLRATSVSDDFRYINYGNKAQQPFIHQ